MKRPAARSGPRPAAASVAVALRRAVAQHQAGRLGAAEAGYRAVLAADPQEPDALHLLGRLRLAAGAADEAQRLIAAAAAARPDIGRFQLSLAEAMLATGDRPAAAAAAARALALAPAEAGPHLALGNIRAEAGDLPAAIRHYEAALDRRPDDPAILNNLAAALIRTGQPAAAEALLERAIARRPGHAGQLANLGLALRDQGRLDAALAALDAAVAADPGHATARANRALLLLQTGDWADGWREYEWRWRAEGFAGRRRDIATPAWDGADPAGLTLLVVAEQGYGSVIQFARYVPVLAARGARLVIECQPPLAALFRRSLPAAVVARGEPLPPHDRHAFLMSLPHLCGTRLSTVPADVPYLRADPPAVAAWRRRLDSLVGRRPRIGLAWAGHPGHGNDHNRSLPAAATAGLLRPLLAARPGAAWVSLQVGGDAARTATALATAGLIDWTDELADFAATAALIEALDLVISVDTAVAHLAGALARPVWLLLPFAGEWRWLAGRDDTPWYPTMRLFRQPAPGDWSALLDRVAGAVAGAVDR